jgi:glutaminase
VITSDKLDSVAEFPSKADLVDALEQAKKAGESVFGEGHNADYIPPLKEVNPRQFGMAVCTVTGREYSIGNASTPFSIQSIAKVFSLIRALQLHQEELWKFVDRMPSAGGGFGSIAELSVHQGRPRNPFVNDGTMVTLDYLSSKDENVIEELLHLVRHASGDEDINSDPSVAQAEEGCADMNYALAYLLRHYGRISLAPRVLLPKYFELCSFRMTCCQLARAGVGLASAGVLPWTDKAIANPAIIRRVNALMLTCGMYGAAGDFAYRVGLPAKNGVGGGILAIVPKMMAIAVWAPELDSTGSSVPGTEALQCFSRILSLSAID